MSMQLEFAFMDSALWPGSASPASLPPLPPAQPRDPFSPAALYRKLGRLIAELDNPAPRVKRRNRLMHVREILE